MKDYLMILGVYTVLILSIALLIIPDIPKSDTPCEEWGDYRLDLVPARCITYFANLQK